MTETAYSGPLPALDDPLTAPHWEAAREHRLAVQRCASCGALRWQPALICPECLTTGGEWTDLAGTGTIWSYTVYHRAMNPAFRGQVPYAVAMVELDEGIRMVGKLTEHDGVAIGQRVQVSYEPVTDEVTLVRWAPDRDAS
jgi:uncharacterized OB-fold protein